MKIAIDVPEGDYNYIKGYGVYAFVEFAIDNSYAIEKLSQYAEAIKNGTPLPEGAEILTKEAYSDLCLRASHERKEGLWDVYTDCEGKRTYYTCPFCKNKTNHFLYEPKYCDECGARLKREGSGADAEKL